MSTMVRKWNHSFVLFAIVLLCSAVSMNAQTNDTTMCNTIQGCGPWNTYYVLVPYKWFDPAANSYKECHITVGYQKRVCPNGVVQIQPFRLHIPAYSSTDDCYHLYYKFITAYDAENWGVYQSLGEQTWSTLVNEFLLEELFNEEYKESGYDSVYKCPNTKTWKVSQPACKGLCLVYFKQTATAPNSAIEIKWMSCGNSCCETTYSICYDTTKNEVVKVQDSVKQIGFCNSQSPVDPDDHCISSGGFQLKGNTFNCKNYCQTTSGLLNNSDNIKDNLFDVQNSILSTNLLLDENNNINNILVSTDVISIEKRNDLKSVKILDLNGEILKEININSLDKKAYFSLSVYNLVNGLYILQFVTDEEVINKQLLIHR